MPVDPQAQVILDAIAASGSPGIHEMTPAEARAAWEAFAAMAPERPGDPPLASVEDAAVPGPRGDVPVRVYLPQSSSPPPAVVYLHGGGWVIGSLETHDALCRALAARSGCGLVSVDYSLAPEHPFPAGLHDAYAATAWIAVYGDELGVDGSRLAVAGDSAGGNLAAATCLLALERGGPRIDFQLLIYPSLDLAHEHPSKIENGEGLYLTLATTRWFGEHYLEDPDQAKDPLASPLLAEDLVEVPPAFIVTGEYDVLRDEGEAYAARLAESGVSVTLRRYDGAIHDFVRMATILDLGDAAVTDCAAALRAALLDR